MKPDRVTLARVDGEAATRYYWISWVQPGDDVRPLHYPPGERVLGWWGTGYTQGGQTLCAMVQAASQQEAKDAVRNDWPEADEWRFCDPRETPEVTDRFPLKEWMVERFKTPNERPVEQPVGRLGPKRGIQHPDLTHMRETRRGTQYEVCEWTCPKCRQGRSTLYIDGEWCHGESYHIAFGKGPNGEAAEQCGTCWRAEIDAMLHNGKRPNAEITGRRAGGD